MADTVQVYARIDRRIKEEADEILKQLGISPSCAIQMFYKQVIIHNGIPFDLTLPSMQATNDMTEDK